MKLIKRLKNLNGNDKVVMKNIIGAFIIKGGAMVVSLLTMPAYIKYFGNEFALGVWFTILSMLTWILSFDLGIGNGLRNKLVGAIANNDRQEIKKYISSGFFSITAVVIVIMVVVGIVIPFVNWNSVFNIDSSIYTNQVLITAMLITFGGILLQFIFKIITSIIYALQKSAINNFIMLITSLLQLAYIMIAPKMNVSNALITLSISHVISVCLPMLIAGIVIFASILKDCKPNIKFCTKYHSKAVLGMGGLFFLCQIICIGIFGVNEFLISNLFSPGYVVIYQAYYKIFLLVTTIYSLALTPLWSMITKAKEEKDINWLKKLFKIMEITLLGVVLMETILIFSFDFIAKVWLGNGMVEKNLFYCLNFAVFAIMFIYTTTINTMLNGLGEMKIQFYILLLSLFVKYFVLFLGKYYYNDWIIVVISTTISLIPYCLIIHIYIKKLLNKSFLMKAVDFDKTNK